jgi:regulatory protein
LDAYTAALRILKYRFNSERELRRKLRSKKLEDAEIDEALLRLRAEGWLDDARFAAAMVRTRMAKKVGPLRIRRELGAAGVDREVIDGALDANTDPEATRASLEQLCNKRLRLLTRQKGEEYAASREGRQKVAAYLTAHGYAMAEVLAVLRAAGREPPDPSD